MHFKAIMIIFKYLCFKFLLILGKSLKVTHFSKPVWLLLATLFLSVGCGQFKPEPKKEVSPPASIENSCFHQNKGFISRYFSKASTPQVNNFFNCIDNIIQVFLNHTPREEGKKYYTKKELRIFMQYMGLNLSQAEKVSQALLTLKAGFIGGNQDRLTLKEIETCRKLLAIFKQNLRGLKADMGTLVGIMNKEPVSQSAVIAVNKNIKKLFSNMGHQLSQLNVSSNLLILEKAPENLEILFSASSHLNLNIWSPALKLLMEWKKVFFKSSPAHVIQSADWQGLLDSFGELISLWLYHKRFLENQNWLDTLVINHTQYFLAKSLKAFQKALTKSQTKGIFLREVEQLAQKVWILPYLSTPTFRLGLRSSYCFVLYPLSQKKACEYSTNVEESKISFQNIAFTVLEGQVEEVILSETNYYPISSNQLEILSQHVRSWINEQKNIQDQKPPAILTGWLNRKLGLTQNQELLFYDDGESKLALLSQLNWQAHVTGLLSSAYTLRVQDTEKASEATEEGQAVETEKQALTTGQQATHRLIDQALWDIMIQEWTPFALALYRNISWSQFQKRGSALFQHGDFLTSHSNGDKILQAEEILELFSLSVSALKTTLLAMDMMPSCLSETNIYYVSQPCVWDKLEDLMDSVFLGFPMLQASNMDEKALYVALLRQIAEFNPDADTFDFLEEEQENKDLPVESLFKVFLFAHYQENIMEYLDTDLSQNLSMQELQPLIKMFGKGLSEYGIETEDEALAFITYLFHFGGLPAFSPDQYENWQQNPAKWAEIKIDRTNILQALKQINILAQ